MTFVGLAVTFLGFVIAFISLGVTNSTGVRMVMVLAGIVVSLVRTNAAGRRVVALGVLVRAPPARAA